MIASKRLAAFLLCAATVMLGQQSASEYELKAASLYQFARQTQWPAQVLPNATSTLSICVFKDDDEFTQALRSVVGDKKAGEHPVAIRHVRVPADLRLCHEVFFRGSMEEWRSVLDDLRDAGALTVGEDDRFLASGGMINLSVVDGRIHVEVNAAALARSSVRYRERTLELLASAEPAVEAKGSRPLQFSSLPSFPDIARKMNIRGAVQLEAVVRPDGTVKQVKVLGGHPLLAETAARAVMQWRFRPEESESREVVRVTFRD